MKKGHECPYKEVLGLYRKVFRLSRNWQSATGDSSQTAAEKQYIKDEARLLFRRNQNVNKGRNNFISVS